MNYSHDEITGFEQELKLILQKLAALRTALIIKTNESEKFQLEYEIKQLESRETTLKKNLADAYDLGSDSGKECLREIINALKISEAMGRVHLVNCNRSEIRDRFEQGFDQRQNIGAHNHFYFLSACPTQLPPSLGERMVYELLADWLDEGPDAVHCRFDPKNNDRVKIEKLPLGSSVERSQELFRAFCTRWFGWEQNQDFSEAISANQLPKARHKYSILPFYLRKTEWKPFFEEYFNWMAEQLAKRPPNGPVLMVFIVIYHDNLHRERDEKSEEILGFIDLLCEKHPNAGHFYPLEPVLVTDLRDWFNDLGERNNARLQPVFDTLAEGLPEEELQQLKQSKQFNMDRVELVQELVFELYNQ
jgi:hypothetical protein